MYVIVSDKITLMKSLHVEALHLRMRCVWTTWRNRFLGGQLNQYGTLIWNSCYGGSDQESAFTHELCGTPQILISGYSKSTNGDVHQNAGYNDLWTILIDQNGNFDQPKGGRIRNRHRVHFPTHFWWRLSPCRRNNFPRRWYFFIAWAWRYLVNKLDAQLNLEWEKAMVETVMNVHLRFPNYGMADTCSADTAIVMTEMFRKSWIFWLLAGASQLSYSSALF